MKTYFATDRYHIISVTLPFKKHVYIESKKDKSILKGRMAFKNHFDL
jgi:hypothetical protein